VATLRCEALVLRSVDYSESDRILHLLVPEVGRLTAIAKHARKSVRRFGGTLDLFNRLEVEIARGRGSAMSRLDRARLIHSYAPLRTDPARFALGCYLLEMLDRMAPEGGSRTDVQRLFQFAVGALDWLASHPPNAQVRIFLELRGPDALGVRPELRRCVRCGRDGIEGDVVDFHIPDGGPLCGACAARRGGDRLRVHQGTLRALEQGLDWDLARLDRLVLPPTALGEASRLVSRFQRFHLGVELQSERFLREMLPPPSGRSGAHSQGPAGP
jgi:DNA repair protein RecO (recombination protein O)